MRDLSSIALDHWRCNRPSTRLKHDHDRVGAGAAQASTTEVVQGLEVRRQARTVAVKVEWQLPVEAV